MTDTLQLLIFTPTYENGLRPETVASIVGQQTRHWVTWELGRCNPYPGRDLRNVLAQYTYAREMCLRGPYDAMVTVEHDMILPHYAVRALCETPAPVVYGTYMLRHGEPVLNAWQYIGTAGLGMSLDKYPAELRTFQQAGAGRVSGCGFGCTLIRRQVLEAVPFRASTSVYHAPDMPFALDCVRLGITQLARFDVRCGHIHKGEILETESKNKSNGETVTVTALQTMNVMVEGESVSLIEGETYEMKPEKAQELASLGYVKVGGTKSSPEGYASPRSGDAGDEQPTGYPTAPKVPRKPGLASMAFLQVLTRCYRRPKMLWSNIRSLEAQTDSDWQQTFLIDGEGRGVEAAQAALANYAPYVTGEYIWLLDDDDKCIRPRLVQEVKAIVSEHHPNVIMVRMDHRNGRVLPDDDHWQREPQLSYIGCSAYIVKRQLWQRFAPVFGESKYTSDFDFINAIFGADPDIYWHDVIASQVQRTSMGLPE